MTDLDAVRARLDALGAELAYRNDLVALVAAVKAVLELHEPKPYDYAPDDRGHYCGECACDAPCPTVRAVIDALGGDRCVNS